MGTRGKSTILAFLQAILDRAHRRVRCAEVRPGRTAELGFKDVLVVADTLPGETAFDATMAAAHRAGHLVLNAECPVWVRAAREFSGTVHWISADERQPALREHLGRGGDACFARASSLEVASGACSEPLLSLLEVPALLGGAAQYQVRNAAAAASAGLVLDVTLEQVANGIESLSEACPQRLGRGSSRMDRGARVLLDRVPDVVALSALIHTACGLPSERVQLLLGTESELDAAAWAMEFERVPLGGAHLGPGAGRAGLAQFFAARGIPARLYPLESEARAAALNSRRPGDLLLALRCADENVFFH